MDRRALRRELRSKRRALRATERARLAEQLARNFLHTGLFWRGHRVACYLANDGEMDLDPLMQRLWAAKREVLLPTLHGTRLWFLPYRRETPLVANRFGIAEPALAPRERFEVRSLDLVLMPLVGFDESGNRLGMGGGFYDRTFAFLTGRRRLRRPLLIGVAYELQCVTRLPSRPWDVPMAGVLTERGLRRFNND